MSDDMRSRIRDALLALVPLAIAELAPLTFRERPALALEASETVSSPADELMFASRKKPGVLGPMARGFAALAYQPGGITLLGLHACVHPHIGCPALRARPKCCSCTDETCTAFCRNGCTLAAELCCTTRSPCGNVIEDA